MITEKNKNPGKFRGWSVTLAGTGINLALGMLFAWSVFAAALVERHGWSRTEAALPYTVACVVFAIIMVPAGRLVDKYGPKWIASLGGIFCGLGLIITGISPSLPLAVLGFGLVSAVGMGLGYAAPIPAAVRWFPSYMKGKIAGIVVAGFALAALYISPLTKLLITQWNVQQAFMLEGFLFMGAILAMSQYLTFPPKKYVPPVQKGVVLKMKRFSSYGPDYTPREMLATPQFWLLWVMFALTSSAGLMIIGHLANIVSMQSSVGWGYLMVASLALFNAVGRIVSGHLSDQWGFKRIMLLVFLLQAGNMLLFSSYKSGLLLLIGAVVAGFGYGSLLSLFPSATYSFFGMKNAGMNYGLVFTAWGAGSLIGPIVAGRVADIYGAYDFAFLLSAALSFLAVGLTLVTGMPKKYSTRDYDVTAKTGS